MTLIGLEHWNKVGSQKSKRNHHFKESFFLHPYIFFLYPKVFKIPKTALVIYLKRESWMSFFATVLLLRSSVEAHFSCMEQGGEVSCITKVLVSFKR